MSSVSRGLFKKILEKATNISIFELSTRWIPYVKQDIDIRSLKANEFRFQEWYDLKIKIANDLIPQDDSMNLKIAEQTSLKSLGILSEINHSCDIDNIFGNGKNLRKILCDMVVDHLSDQREEQFIFALTLDKISTVISKEYDKKKFSDPSYISSLISDLNLGYPILFASKSVRDNPNVVLESFNKKSWYFDMSSQRLKDLARNEDPKNVLEKDILRLELLNNLNINSSVSSRKSKKI